MFDGTGQKDQDQNEMKEPVCDICGQTVRETESLLNREGLFHIDCLREKLGVVDFEKKFGHIYEEMEKFDRKDDPGDYGLGGDWWK